LYCGDSVEISQPLLPMGIKTPISMVRALLDDGALVPSKTDATTEGSICGVAGRGGTRLQACDAGSASRIDSRPVVNRLRFR
jgi:hypothetical protein